MCDLWVLFYAQRLFRIFYNMTYRVYNKLDQSILGFDIVMKRIRADSTASDAKRQEIRAAQLRAREEKIYGEKDAS